MKKICILFVVILLSCTTKKHDTPLISLIIKNKILNNENLLQVNFINNTEQNYFIMLDSFASFRHNDLSEIFNNSINMQPIFFLGVDSIDVISRTNMVKSINYDTSNFNCIKRKMIVKEYKFRSFCNLKNKIFIPKKQSVQFNLPFNNIHISCNKKYFYFNEKGSYYVKFKYKLNKKFFFSNVDKFKLSILKDSGFVPFTDEIKSNKIPLIIN